MNCNRFSMTSLIHNEIHRCLERLPANWIFHAKSLQQKLSALNKNAFNVNCFFYAAPFKGFPFMKGVKIHFKYVLWITVSLSQREVDAWHDIKHPCVTRMCTMKSCKKPFDLLQLKFHEFVKQFLGLKTHALSIDLST